MTPLKLIRQRNLPNFKKKKAGSAPGTVAHIGRKVLENMSINILDYDHERLTVEKIDKVTECKPFAASKAVTWVEVMGLHETDKLKTLWDDFGFHPLIQEDIVNTLQRPKVEDYGEQIFIVMKMLKIKDGEIQEEQVSLVLSSDYVFSFQETDDPFFDPIKTRLQVENSRIRKAGTDYLAYALMDAIIDYYFETLEEIGNKITEIEDEIFEKAKDSHLKEIHNLRRELINFRKSVWPLRDGINSMLRDESPLIDAETKLFIRDTFDHLFQVIEMIDNSREMLSGLYDMYMTDISNRMNEVMKVLTIIATIFIPLTFIAGIYGMNFADMPELNWKYGYPTVWVVMITLTVIMIIYFKRKRWL